jgi:dihydroorotate dehydrogenase electron transfer subunit
VLQTRVIIVERETIGPAWWRLVLDGPELAAQLTPGQFLLVRCADPFTSYLRRPIFPEPLNDGQLELLLRPTPDPGLAWLSTRQVGDELDVIGPLGQGYPLSSYVRNLLLVSDGQALSPLLGQMNRAVQAGLSATLLLGGQRAAALYPLDRLPPAVEVQLATLDGSAGHRGPLTALLPDLLCWADGVCAVGSISLYRALKDQVAAVRLSGEAGFLYGLVVEGLLPCGVGACLACTVPAIDGLRLTCVDGPIFDLMPLDFTE